MSASLSKISRLPSPSFVELGLELEGEMDIGGVVARLKKHGAELIVRLHSTRTCIGSAMSAGPKGSLRWPSNPVINRPRMIHEILDEGIVVKDKSSAGMCDPEINS